MKRGEVAVGSKTALVTGASAGIGRCYARRLAGLGYNLVIVSRDGDRLNELADELRGTYCISVMVVVMDLARERAAYELYDLVKSEGIEVDVLVNNAGMFSFLDILKTPTERISRLLLLHDMTLTLNCRLFGEDMARRGGGHILNMSSFSIWMPFPGLSLYSASKSYVKSFSVAFSKEVQELGIKCTAVCPAGIATDLYGLPADWQRFGVRIGVLMTTDRCAKKGLRAMVARAPQVCARLVEQDIHTVLSDDTISSDETHTALDGALPEVIPHGSFRAAVFFCRDGRERDCVCRQ